MDYNISAKNMGLLVIALSFIFGAIMLSTSKEIINAETMQCEQACGTEMPEGCPHENNLPPQTYAGFTASFILAGLGIYMIISGRKYREEMTESEKKISTVVSLLSKDEMKIYNMVKSSEGAVLQSELIQKSEESKVKVSRILDKLEGRGLLERKRRGMTNLVVLKKI